MTKPADLEIASAPYNCTVPSNGTAVNKYDGLIHEEGGKRTFSDDGCVVGGVNDSYKHTGHPLNKTKIAEDAGETNGPDAPSNSTTSANATSTTPATANSTTTATPAASSNSTSSTSA